MRFLRWLRLFFLPALLSGLLLAPAQGRAAAPVVAAVGDIGCPFGLQPDHIDRPLINAAGVPSWPSFCRQAQTARLVASAGDYNAVLALGDLLAPDASLSDFLQAYEPSWGEFRSITLPVVGNHEYSGGQAEGYFDYFEGRNVGVRGEGWYKRRLGRWLVIGLNSNCDYVGCLADSPQVAWLKDLLRRNRKALRKEARVRAARERRRQARRRGRTKFHRALPTMPKQRGSTCILAAWHHPRFSSGRHGNTYDTGAFWRTLRRFGGDVVLNGHDHLYERFTALAPSGAADPGGVTQFTVGTGGRSLFRFVGDPHPGSVTRIERTFGILRLRLLPTAFRWNFINTDGEVLDYGTTPCNPKLG